MSVFISPELKEFITKQRSDIYQFDWHLAEHVNEGIDFTVPVWSTIEGSLHRGHLQFEYDYHVGDWEKLESFGFHVCDGDSIDIGSNYRVECMGCDTGIDEDDCHSENPHDYSTAEDFANAMIARRAFAQGEWFYGVLCLKKLCECCDNWSDTGVYLGGIEVNYPHFDKTKDHPNNHLTLTAWKMVEEHKREQA